MNYTTHHYWITDSKGNILDVCKLNPSGKEKILKRKIYKSIKSLKTNRSISMVENKVISEMNIYDLYKVETISDRCRILYNDHYTIVEIDGYNSDIALEIFSSICNNDEEFVIFDIDDKAIKGD